MHPNHHFPFLQPRQQSVSCITCPDPEPCNCLSNQLCERQIQTCTACGQNVCVANPALTPKKSTVGSGPLIGAVVGVILLLAFVVAGYIHWRRRTQRIEQIAAQALEKNISPFDLNGAPSIQSVAHTQSGPTTPQVMFTDPNTASPTLGHSSPGGPGLGYFGQAPGGGDVRVYVHDNSSIDLNNPAGAINPFNDSASMTTMSTNVIPIAYVPPTSTSMSISDGHTSSSGHSSHQQQYQQPPLSPGAPSRPAREPGLDLRLPSSAVTRAGLMDGSISMAGDLKAPKTPYAASARSGYSGISNRSSIISSSSSVLYERPMIVTSAKVGRQVLGVMRAEVVNVGSSLGQQSAPSTPGSTSTGYASGTTLRARTSVRSPLAGSGFTAGDVAEVPPLPSLTAVAAATSPSSPAMSTKSDPFSDMKTPTNAMHNFSLGLPSPTSVPLPESTQPSPSSGSNRELPPSAGFHSQHFPRESTSSFMSSGSRADSFLNGFAFVPPTPTSGQSLPPLTFNNTNLARANAESPMLPSAGSGGDSSINTQHTFGHIPRQSEDVLPGNLGRRITNYSVRSNASTGLGAFPFQFGGGHDIPSGPDSARNTLAAAPQSSAVAGMGRSTPNLPSSVYGTQRVTGGVLVGTGERQRASLDTLALSREVDEYALPYGR
ncbi:hypothetical protein FRB94_012418 [Tulasnella sp. JGI-2019a]|nr:hypothetical protein FRB93_010453 [Tulasnella sp. JGI-2019a]KAG9009146.1 hypothetical protein FRB94_012418 [Tulasnella sp. JGI-2019a]KAG9038353.1 hypothetical protein FRB95_001765 [Tulasnella sp. JGI-2019a]